MKILSSAKFVLLMACGLAYTFTKAQNIAINKAGNPGKISAVLDLSDPSNKTLGMLFPRVGLTDVTVALPILSPIEGLIVYDTAISVTGGFGQGFYYWSGSAWTYLSNSGTASVTADNGLNRNAGNNVEIGGDLIKATTITNNGNIFKITGSTQSTTILSSGLVGIGMTTPLFPLDVESASGNKIVEVRSTTTLASYTPLASFDGDLGATPTSFDKTLAVNNNGAVGNAVRIGFADNNAGEEIAQIEAKTTGSAGTGYIAFQSSSAASMYEGLRIMGAGLVGVGTTTPSGLFSVGAGVVSPFQVNGFGDISEIAGINYAWPTAQATQSGQVLTNDASGNLTWVTPSAVSGILWQLVGNAPGATTNIVGTTDGLGTVNIQNGTTIAGTINLGMATVSNTIGIGNQNLTAGTQTINIGVGSGTTGVEAITIGSNTAAAHTTAILGGNGADAITVTPQTTGSVVIGASAGTGQITVGSSSVAQTVAIGAGAGANAVNIATAGSGVVNIGNNTGSTGVNNASPHSTLDVNGSYGSGLISVNSATTLTNAYNTVLMTPSSSGAYTVTLPTVTSSIRRIYNLVFNGAPSAANSYGINITVNGSDASAKIFYGGIGVTTYPVYAGALEIQTDGSNWYVISGGPNKFDIPFASGINYSFPNSYSCTAYSGLTYAADVNTFPYVTETFNNTNTLASPAFDLKNNYNLDDVGAMGNRPIAYTFVASSYCRLTAVNMNYYENAGTYTATFKVYKYSLSSGALANGVELATWTGTPASASLAYNISMTIDSNAPTINPGDVVIVWFAVGAAAPSSLYYAGSLELQSLQ